MTDELELRLRELPTSAVLLSVDESAIARLQPGSSKTRRGLQTPAAAAAALIAILLANVVAAYFAPRYERALADSGVGPISQRFLAAVGLNDANVTAVNDSATSAGHTIRLVAGYSDGLRTVLLVTIDGRGLTGDPKKYGLNPGDYGVDYNDVTLTDQFGRHYDFSGIGGPTDIQFQPLLWPASEVGGRLTLHITALDAVWQRNTQAVSGDWTLHAVLVTSPAHTIALPAPVHVAMADYTFIGISASETEMVLHWTVGGPAIDQLAKDQASAPKNADPFGDPLFDQYLRPQVYAESGSELQFQDWGYTWPKSGPAQGGMTVFINGSGRYRIQIGTEAEARWVIVP